MSTQLDSTRRLCLCLQLVIVHQAPWYLFSWLLSTEHNEDKRKQKLSCCWPMYETAAKACDNRRQVVACPICHQTNKENCSKCVCIPFICPATKLAHIFINYHYRNMNAPNRCTHTFSRHAVGPVRKSGKIRRPDDIEVSNQPTKCHWHLHSTTKFVLYRNI